MYITACVFQLVAMLCALMGGCLALTMLWPHKANSISSSAGLDAENITLVRLVERCHWAVSSGLLLASAILLHALFWNDFSVKYVASYTDLALPLFYRLSAFWAGQPGSMLFWATAVAVSGSVFAITVPYRRLSRHTRLWYWTFFYAIMAFFCLILSCWSNPFLLQQPAPADGSGLNPLLQNPGMILHPPLLFLGYGGFTVPACLALAQSIVRSSSKEGEWFSLTKPFLLVSWSFLTAGIVLGAWWAYMELGWGGYWAWDPVENASLVPWLVATAAIHTIAVQKTSGKLARCNTVLVAMVTISAFFATWLVRSGVIDSVHAFGDGGVGVPLLIFVCASVLITVLVFLLAPKEGKSLEGVSSREGLLGIMAWIFPALAVIILVATLWPVLSKIAVGVPRGLDAGFYNRVCLPIGTLLMLAMAICPCLGWKGGIPDRPRLYFVLVVFGLSAIVMMALGYNKPVAVGAASSATAFAAGCLFMLCRKFPGMGKNRGGAGNLSFIGIHLGMAMIAFGIAFSGPYTEDREFWIGAGQVEKVGNYEISLISARTSRGHDYDALVASLKVSRDGKEIGILNPERRIHDKFGDMQFAEVDVASGFVRDIYASLLGIDDEQKVMVKISIEPFVSWLWIGGILLCVFPFMALGSRSGKTKLLGNGA